MVYGTAENDHVHRVVVVAIVIYYAEDASVIDFNRRFQE